VLQREREAAGVKFGQDLRDPVLTTYVVVEATDGYRSLLALPELDPAFTDRVVLPIGGTKAARREGRSPSRCCSGR
jgi:hypothetical protein